MEKDRKELAVKALSFILWIMVYELISKVVGKSLLVPSVKEIISAFIHLCAEPMFRNTVFFSVLRIFTGFFAAAVFGVITAYCSYFYKIFYYFIYPVVSIIRAVPVASFIILTLLWIKSGYVPAFISFLIVFPVIWSNIFQGLKETDSKLIEMAKIFDFSFFKKIRMIYFPQTKPFFKSAGITGLGLAWKSGIAAEVISMPKLSIGRSLYEAKLYIETPELFAWTLTVIILSIITEKVLTVLFKWGLKER